MKAKIWNCAEWSFDLEKPLVMGICNVTPDSFSDGGEHNAAEDAIAFALEMVEQGADMIDVGGESTRPGSTEVSVEEEIARVVPVIKALSEKGVAVSVDTRHAGVAKAALDAGACIINDVSGLRDRAMREVLEASDAGVVIMHMLGTPEHMQDNPQYKDVVFEVEENLTRMGARVEAEGVDKSRVCIDPGVGFGKGYEHNEALLLASDRLSDLDYPLMVAVSRKSYIGLVTGKQAPKDRDLASALCAVTACNHGARIIRAHNVPLTCQALAESRRAIIALGSNMGNPSEELDFALEALRKVPGVWVGLVSPYVTSEPAYYEDQSRFVNAVAEVQTMLSPDELLDALHEIENAQGRERTISNGPRTLDLDIVDYEGVVRDDDVLKLPHPLALERDFVVTPLLEIFPEFVLSDGARVTKDKVSVGKVTGIASDINTR